MNERTFSADRAQVLDDPQRNVWLPPDAVIQQLGLRADDVVADVGAGTGYFALPLSNVVRGRGKVIAVDFQPAMLERIRAKLSTMDAPTNIELVVGSATATGVREKSVDLVFMANLWHELDDYSAALDEAQRILKKGGRLAIIDWRTDLPSPPGPPAHHRVSLEAAIRTLTGSGWGILSSGPVGLYSHFVVAVLPNS